LTKSNFGSARTGVTLKKQQSYTVGNPGQMLTLKELRHGELKSNWERNEPEMIHVY
jgi:hypothetical protein